jgi:hypothetical protein
MNAISKKRAMAVAALADDLFVPFMSNPPSLP